MIRNDFPDTCNLRQQQKKDIVFINSEIPHYQSNFISFLFFISSDTVQAFKKFHNMRMADGALAQKHKIKTGDKEPKNSKNKQCRQMVVCKREPKN